MDSIFHPHPSADPPHPHSQYFSDWTGEHTGDGFPGVENAIAIRMTSLDIYVDNSASVTVAAIGATYSYGWKRTYTSYYGNAYRGDANARDIDDCQLLPSVTRKSVDLSARSVKELNVWAVERQDAENRISGIELTFDDDTSEMYGAESGNAKRFAFEGQELVALNGFAIPLQSSSGPPCQPVGSGHLAALGCVFGPPPPPTFYPYPPVDPPYPPRQFFSDWTGEHTGDFPGVQNVMPARMTSIDIYVSNTSYVLVVAIGATYSYGTNQTYTSFHGDGKKDGKLWPSVTAHKVDLTERSVTELKVWGIDMVEGVYPASDQNAIQGIGLTFDSGKPEIYGGASGNGALGTCASQGHVLLALNGFAVPPQKGIDGHLGVSGSLVALGCVFGPPPTT